MHTLHFPVRSLTVTTFTKQCPHLCGILIDEMGVLGSASPPKVLHLHDLWQHCLVKVVLQCGLAKVSFEHLIFFILENLAQC